MNATRRKVLIIGGGIGGPVAALLLKRAGVDVAIYEASPAPDDYAGLFLNVASNGQAVLKTLGLAHQIAAHGFACPRMIMWSGSGKRLGEVRNGAAAGQGAVSVVIKRGVLNRIVREEATRHEIPIAFGKKLRQIELTAAEQVIAHFEDGTHATGDLLVGCDGIHSRTRQWIDPHAPAPVYTGQLSIGGFAHSAALPPTSETQHFIFGQRAFFGYLVQPSGEIFWFNNLACRDAPQQRELSAIPSATWQQRLLDLHSADQPFINEIIRATDGPIGAYPIYDVPTLPRWHRGPVVLLGDAAHATSPSGGQGASLALEDAIVLAQCVRDLPRLTDALATYERLRRGRAEKVVKLSRQLGQNKIAAHAVSRWLRDLTMPLALKLFANAQSLAWLYSYNVDWNARVA